MSNLKELAVRLKDLILDCRTHGQDEIEASWGEQTGVLLSWGTAQDVVDLIEQATQPERPAPDPTARPFPAPQDFTLVPITEKQAVGMAFDLGDSGFDVVLSKPGTTWRITIPAKQPKQ